MHPPKHRARVRSGGGVRSAQRAWNAFVDWLRTAPVEELTPLQRDACLVFRYDAEVHAGGHRRFLEGQAAERVEQTAQALARLGGEPQQGILQRAAGGWNAAAGAPPGELLDHCDRDYFASVPEVHELLQRCLEARSAEFIEWC